MRAAWLLVPLLLAGCLGNGVSEPPPAQVMGVAFDDAGSPWRAFFASGCGLCSGQGGPGLRHEHDALFVFDNARLVLVDFNVRPGGAGFHLNEGITYDLEGIESLLAGVDRAQGEVWVVRLYTGELRDAATPQRLADAWRDAQPVSPAADYAVQVGVSRGGEVERQTLAGPLAPGDPFRAFVDELASLRTAARVDGARQGPPMPR